MRNPYVMLREEFDDWAVLFDPDAALGFGGFGLNPTGVYLWKLLDGEHTIDDLLQEFRGHAHGVPEDAGEHIRVFVDALSAEGLATHGNTGSYREKCSHDPLAVLNGVKPFGYEQPKLINLSSGLAALGSCSNHGSNPTGNCTAGPSTGYCMSGTTACVPTSGCPADTCCNGFSVTTNCHGGSSTSNCCASGNSASGSPTGCCNGPWGYV